MSGLVHFFRDHRGLSDDDHQGSCHKSCAPEVEYAKSLDALDHSNDRKPRSDEDDDDDNLSECELSWDEWRARHKSRLVAYLHDRLGAGPSREPTAATTSQSDHHNGSISAMKDGSDDPKSSRIEAVVNVHDTHHDVHYLSDLTLSTRKLVSSLCLIENICQERLAKRPSLRRTTRRSAASDGPLIFIYKRVVSFEVVQKLCGQKDELRQRAQNCLQMGNKSKNRIKVFLYNNYASGFSQILSLKPSKDHKLALRMENIPALCIFPYETKDWTEDDMAPFCICVGDKSAVKLDDESLTFDEGVRLQFQFTEKDVPQASGKVFTLQASEHKVSLEQSESESLGGSARQAGVLERQTAGEHQRSPSNSLASLPTAQTFDSTVPNQNGTSAGGLPSFQTPTNKFTIMYYKLNQMRDVLRRQKDLKATETVSLYAVVLGFSAPRLTKRGEWSITASLIDDTVSLRTGTDKDHPEVESISINFFSRKKERLPALRFCGDVIRLHRAKVNEYKEEVQLLGQAPTSYVTFRVDTEDPQRGDSWTATAVARGYELDEDELAMFLRLWKWGQRRIQSFPTMKPAHRTMICDLLSAEAIPPTEGDRDFTLMVGAILPIPQDPRLAGVTPRGLLRVWDGTGLPRSDPFPELIPADLAEAAVVDGDPPGSCLDKLGTIVDRLRSEWGSEINVPESLTGRVANVVVWEDAHWELVQTVLQAGMFIRLRNVRESILYGTSVRCLNVSSMSYLNPLPDITYEVVQLVEAHDTRLLRGEDYNPSSGVSSLRPEERPAWTRMESKSAVPSSASPVSPAPAGQVSREAPQVLPSPASKRAKTTTTMKTCQTLRSLLTGPVGSVFWGRVRLTGTVPPVDPGDSTTMRLLLAHNASRRRPSRAGVCVWRFAAVLEDEVAAGSILTAIVTDAVGEALLGRNATEAQRYLPEALDRLEDLVRGRRLLEVRVRSVELQGAMYFLADGIRDPVP